MPDRKFQIDIATSFNPAGTQQAAEGLQNVSKATGQAGEKAETFNKHGREMHELFHKLNSVAPGLGESLKAILSPEAAPLIGIIVALELFAKLIEKIKADAEDFRKTLEMAPDLSGIKNSVESIASGLAEADRKAGDFTAKIEEIMAAEVTMAKGSEDQIKALEHQLTVEQKIADAKTQQARAELELKKSKGEITPAQYDLSVINLDSRSAREAAQRQVDYLNKEKSQVERDRDDARDNVEQLSKQEKAVQERVAAADNNLKDAEQRRAHAKQELEETTKTIAGTKEAPGLQQKVDEFREKMFPQMEGMSDAELRAYLGKLNAAGSNTTLEEKDYRRQIEQYLELADHLGDVRRQQAGFASKYRASEGGIESAKGEKSTADKALETLQTHITENANSVKTLTERIDELNRKLDEHKDDSRVFNAQDSASIAKMLPDFEKSLGVDSDSGIAAFVQKFFEAQNRIQQHHGTAGDSQTVAMMNQLLSGTRQSDQRLFAVIQALINHVGNRDSTLSNLERQIASLRSSMPRNSSTGQ